MVLFLCVWMCMFNGDVILIWKWILFVEIYWRFERLLDFFVNFCLFFFRVLVRGFVCGKWGWKIWGWFYLLRWEGGFVFLNVGKWSFLFIWKRWLLLVWFGLYEKKRYCDKEDWCGFFDCLSVWNYWFELVGCVEFIGIMDLEWWCIR